MPRPWVNQAAWPGNAAAGTTGENGAAFPTPDVAPTEMTRGMTTPERLQWRILRRRYLTLGGVGVNVAVTNGATSLSVTFARPEPDVSYGVTVTPSWLTTVSVSPKVVGGFTISFGTAAPGTGSPTCDWTTFRQES